MTDSPNTPKPEVDLFTPPADTSPFKLEDSKVEPLNVALSAGAAALDAHRASVEKSLEIDEKLLSNVLAI